MNNERTAREPVKIFCSYPRKDEAYLEELKIWLAGARREGLIEEWHDRRIGPGQKWKEAIDKKLKAADVILLLVSPDFVHSDYAYEKEMKQALERHERGEARVIPIIVRPTDWEGCPFGNLQALPRDARPITRWPDRDEAWHDVVKGIRRAVEELPPTVQIPSLIGKNASQARSMLADAGLTMGDREEAPSETAPEGEIVGQTPEAGTKVRPGRRVSVTTSTGPGRPIVPNVSGKSLEEAGQYLESIGLRLADSRTKRSFRRVGTVVSTKPPAGTQVTSDTEIIPIISAGLPWWAPVATLVLGILLGIGGTNAVLTIVGWLTVA